MTKTNALETLMIASFVRGLPVRDVEAALAEALGDQAAVSRSTVPAICQAIKDEYQSETSRFTLRWAVPDCASKGWRGVNTTTESVRATA